MLKNSLAYVLLIMCIVFQESCKSHSDAETSLSNVVTSQDQSIFFYTEVKTDNGQSYICQKTCPSQISAKNAGSLCQKDPKYLLSADFSKKFPRLYPAVAQGGDAKFIVDLTPQEKADLKDLFSKAKSENGTTICGGSQDTATGAIYPQNSHAFPYGNFYEGLANFKDNNSGRYGYMNLTGKIVIPANYDFAGSFQEGLAPVYFKNKCGYINQTGKQVIPLNFGACLGFSGGAAKVYAEEPFYAALIDPNGKFLTKTKLRIFGHELQNDRIQFYDNSDKIGYLNSKGEAAIAPQFDYASSFTGGIARAQIGGSVFAIDTAGQKISNKIGYYFSPCPAGGPLVAWYHSRGDDGFAPDAPVYGFIKIDSTVVIRPSFDVAECFSDGVAKVLKNNKYGYVQEQGRWLIEPQFQEASSFHDGTAWVRFNDKWYLINKQNQALLKDYLEVQAPDFGDVIWALHSSKEYHAIDRKGKILIRFKSQ